MPEDFIQRDNQTDQPDQIGDNQRKAVCSWLLTEIPSFIRLPVHPSDPVQLQLRTHRHRAVACHTTAVDNTDCVVTVRWEREVTRVALEESVPDGRNELHRTPGKCGSNRQV